MVTTTSGRTCCVVLRKFSVQSVTMLRIILVILASVFTFTFAQDLYADSPCSIRGPGPQNIKPGICQPLRACPSVMQNIRRERPTPCSYTNDPRNPIICCPTAGSPAKPVATTPPPRMSSLGGQVSFSNSDIPPFDPNSKSERKCREYAKEVYQLQRPPSLTVDEDVFINKSVCAAVATPLVVGGEPAQLNEFPHMALLGYGPITSPNFLCGGSLISDRYVLTAAHCLSSREEGPVSVVRVGDLEISNPYDGSEPQQVAVSERIAHPEYILPGRYNDIALLKLAEPVKFSASVRPACIHRSKILPNDGRDIKLIATGWGRIGFSESTSDKLLKVALSPIPHEPCNRTYRVEATTSKLRKGIEDNSMVCAGEPEGGKDTCQGDSGGPLQYRRQDPYCMYNVVGVTSFGKFCGYKNSPAVYTRASNYMDWIENIVWPNF